MSRHIKIRSLVLLATVAGTAVALAGWKQHSLMAAEAASANQPEYSELVSAAFVQASEYRPSTIAVGTVLALRSVTVSNEVAGTVRHASLHPGEIIEAGSVLLALDVSVEQAELKAQQAKARLADTRLQRLQQLHGDNAVSQDDVDRAMAERDVAHAEVERLKAIIERKTIRAPFRARVGISDVHVGQYLNAGTPVTTLQSVSDAVHIDFQVTQQVAAQLRKGQLVELLSGSDATQAARIVAIDSRIDPVTRNATIRARIDQREFIGAPGGSVKVRVPVGDAQQVVSIPVTGLRKGPAGDHVFLLAKDDKGQLRAKQQFVRIGPMQGDAIIILDGLQEGDQIAASGSFKLHDAIAVSVANEPSTAMHAAGGQ